MPPARHLAATWLLRAACLTLAVLFAVPAAAVTGNGRLQIHHMDVGQGDGLVIISPFGQTALVDDGVYTDCTKVKAYLQSLGITQLDYHFASHYHADHVGCIDDLAAIGITVQVAGWDRGYSYTTATYTTYVNTLGAKRRTLAKGQVILLDSLAAHPVRITCVDLNGAGVYSPTGSDENAKGVVLKVSYGEFDAVLGGDLTGSTSQGSDVESTVGPEVGPVEVYKVHHHGSRYSSNANWLAATQPKIGVISCGTGNSYGHPTADALGRLHAAGVRTYWTETGAGATPDAAWDRVANGHIVISATWEPAGVDTVRGPAFADTFTNSGTALDTTPPTVVVTAPNGGEAWLGGSMQTVVWSAADNVGVVSIDIDYSLSGADGPWTPIAHGLANTGAYDWTVGGGPSDSALVRVTAFDLEMNASSDDTDDLFHIVVPAAGVPGGGRWALALAPPEPNPTSGSSLLGFTLPAAAPARLEVLDLAGRRLWSEEGWFPAGTSARRWDGATIRGDRAGAGLYFVRLVTPWGARMMRLVVLR